MCTNPGEANTTDSVAEHVAEDGGEGVTCREVCVEPRMLPVRHLQNHKTNFLNPEIVVKLSVYDHYLVFYSMIFWKKGILVRWRLSIW